MRFLILPKQDFGMTVSSREQGGMKLRVNADITFERNTVNAQLHSPHGSQKRLSSRSAARDLTVAFTMNIKKVEICNRSKGSHYQDYR